MNFFQSILSFDTLDSTSTFLKEHYQNLMNHTVVTALYQTEGKGQFDRKWESEKGKNILFSVLFKDDTNTEKVNDAFIQSITGILNKYQVQCWYKEPNDIYVDEDKIAGILMETKYNNQEREYLVVGIGINLNQQYFQSPHATSLSLLTGISYEIKKIFSDFLQYFEGFLTH